MASETTYNPISTVPRYWQLAFAYLSLLLMVLSLSACGGGAGTVGTPTGKSFYTTAPVTITLAIGAIGSYEVGGGTAIYKATSSNATVLSAEVNGTSLSLKGLQNGIAQVLISDATGAQLSLSVTVGSGNAAVNLFVTAPKELRLATGMSGSYIIAGGKPTYFVSSSNASVATVGINNNSFIISGSKAGVAQIIVLDSAGDAVTLNVTVGNGGALAPLYASVAGTLSLKIAESQDYTIAGGVGPYLASSNHQSVATVQLSGNVVSVKGISKGSAQIMIFDATGASISTTVVVDPNGVAIPFYLAAPASITMAVGAKASYNIGGGTAPYVVTSSNKMVVNASFNAANNTLSIDALLDGETQILVFDATGTKVSTELKVGTGNANPNTLYTTAGTAVVMQRMASNIYAIGGGKSPYTVASNNTRVATVSNSSSTTSLSITGGDAGSAVINVFDATGASVSFTVTVSPSNGDTKLFTTAGIDLSLPVNASAVYKIGGGTAPYAVTSNNVTVANASFNAVNSTFSIETLRDGKAQILVFDATGSSVPIALTVGAGSANSTALYTTAGAGVTMPKLASNTYLIGGGKAPYNVTSSNTKIATVMNSGSSFSVSSAASGNAVVTVFDVTGASVSFAVTVSANDNQVNLFTTAGNNLTLPVGARVSYSIGGGTAPYVATSGDIRVVNATINAANNQLIIDSLREGNAQVSVFDATGTSVSIALTVGAGTTTPTALYTTAGNGVIMPNMATNTYIIAGGKGPYTLSSNNTRVATVSSLGASSSLSVTSVGIGSALINVFDANGTSVSFTVTVSRSDNSINLFTTAGSMVTLAAGAPESYTIGGGSAPYTVSNSNVGVARVSVNGSNLSITPISAGSTEIVVFDSNRASVMISLTVTSTTVAPIDVQPNGASGNVGNVLQFLISAGRPPYAITVNNPGIASVSPLVVNNSGGSFSATLLNEGVTTISILDGLGQVKTISLTVGLGTPSSVTVQPDGAGGNVGDALQFLIKSGTPPYTLTVNNPSIVSVTPNPVLANGGSFTANLLNVGSSIITITDASGQIRAFTLTASQINTILRLSPNPFLLSEDNLDTINLNIYGGTPPYRAFTSDQRLSSVSVAGSVLSVALGSNGDRCVTPADSGGTRISFGTFDVTITVLDSLGAAATSIMMIKDNGRGDGVTLPLCN